MLKIEQSSLSIATSVFSARKTRELDFYLVPANHLLEDMTNSKIKVYLFTNLSEKEFVQAPNITIIREEPEYYIRDIWEDPNWQEIYVNKLKDMDLSFNEHKQNPKLLAIWLGKLEMLNIASKSSDMALWFDSGYRLGIWQRQFSRYKKRKINPKEFLTSITKTLGNHDFVFSHLVKKMKIFHKIDMSKYDPKGPCLQGNIYLAKSSKVPWLKERFKYHWNRLIDNNDYGTDEQPLTMCYWDVPQSPTYSYPEWLQILKLKK